MGGGGEGEWGTKLPISLHYLAQGEGQGGGLGSLPLAQTEELLHIIDLYRKTNRLYAVAGKGKWGRCLAYGEGRYLSLLTLSPGLGGEVGVIQSPN